MYKICFLSTQSEKVFDTSQFFIYFEKKLMVVALL